MSIEVPIGFSEEVRSRLAEVAQPTMDRPVAVFDFDNTCVHGDIGEIFSQWLVDKLAYRVDLDVFWDQIDPRDGRDEARMLVERLRGLADDAPERAEIYEAYRAEMAAIYPRLMGREGKAAAYAWAVLLHVGLTEKEMFELSERCVREAWAMELGHERMRTSGGDEFCYEVGIRRFAAIRRIMDWLRACGYEVWVVSATNYWTVSTAARILFGHDPNFVVGNRVHVDTGVLTAKLIPPALFRAGKVEAIQREIGVRPAIVFGDSETDLSMLEWAESLSVLIDNGDQIAGEAAERLNWAVQSHAELELEGPQA